MTTVLSTARPARARTLKNVAELVAARQPFTFPSMSGKWVNEMVLDTGRMSQDHRAELNDLIEAWGAAYVVYSYATPIAALSPHGGVVFDARYSVTTSRHQTLARLAI